MISAAKLIHMQEPTLTRHAQRHATTRAFTAARPLALAALSFALVAFTPPGQTAQTQVASSPLASATSAQVKPNIMYLMDTSGSMDSLYMPDAIGLDTAYIGYKNYLCNYIYYNPAINYLVPKKSNGSNFSTASFTAAYSNGYTNYPTGPTSGAINLSSAFKAHSGDTSQNGYYYKYTGSQTLTPHTGGCLDSDPNSTTTYNVNIATTGGGNWQKIKVTSTSGPGSTDERVNFANWYQYYRSRLMMMKATASRAFNQLTDSYRVGFITISPGNPVNSSQYVAIADFDTTQRTNWFTTLFAQATHDSTPLREALSRVGRHYAGLTDGLNSGMSGDPVQYSCQQNFTLLTTDGYWNGNAGVALNGTSAVGNTDGDIAIAPRPMWDGTSTFTVVTTKTNTYNRNVACSTAIQRRVQQIQKRTVQYQQQTTQIQSRTEQIQQRTEQYRQTTVSTTAAAKTNIIIQTVAAGASWARVTIGATDELPTTISPTGATAAARITSARTLLAASTFTNGYTVTGSGACSATNDNPVSGCRSGREYVTLMAPASAGNFAGAVNVSTGNTGITAAAVNFSGGQASTSSTVNSTTLCSSSSNITGNARSDISCTTSDSGFVSAASCTDTAGAFNGSGTRVSCNTTAPGFVNAASCTDTGGAFNGSGARIACQTTDTGMANSGRCTASVSGGQTVTCSITSDTGFVNASSCTASATATQPTIDCQTTDTGFVNASSCAASSSGGQTVTCLTGQSGKKIQYSTTTSITTTNDITGVATTPTPTTGAAVNYDNVCYAGGNGMPATTDGIPAPTEAPLPTAPCTAWPCTTTTSSGGTSNTLADIAQYYYQTDLRPSMDNNVPASGSRTEDDKATWQHMTTFTMGLGMSGTVTYSSTYKTDNTGDFQNIRDGSLIWPTPVADGPTALDDLWHAAVNGRGQYFSARDPDQVVSGLEQALAGINARIASAAAAATSNLEPVAGDNFAYTAKYKTIDWTGELEAHEIDLTTGAVKTAVIWSAQSALDAKTGNLCDNRTIYLFRSGASNNRTPFTWNTSACDSGMAPTGTATTGLNSTEQGYFSSTQLAALSQYATMTDGTGTPATDNQRGTAYGDKLVNFVRGQRYYEGYVTNNANKLYRTRANVLGDIVNAQPVYVKAPFGSFTDSGYSTFKSANASRTPMVYVAANDGMLHGFYAGTSASDANGGKEAWAFIPSIVLPNLYKLADDNYANTHAYSVDGTPTVGDFYDSAASTWKTMLVAGLNAGGRGYYALDVTDPASPKGLWEFKWSDTCYDATNSATAYADCHVGLTFNDPLITKLSDGTWVVIVTSGVNNVNSPNKTGDGLGYLYVLRAYDGKILYKIATTAGTAATPSGLNHAINWVDNTTVDNTTLRVYAGDLLGNLWRFDVNDTINPTGREATLIGTAKAPNGTAQPISTRPEVALNGSQPFILFGTGRMLGSSDLTDTQVQSIYGVIDPLTATTAYTDLRGSMKPMTMTQVGTGSTATRTIACAGTSTQCNLSSGWVVNLPDSGERVNVDVKLQLGTLVVASNVPQSSACTIGGYSWINYFNFSTGTAVANSTGGAVSQKLSDSLAVGLNIVRLPDGRTVVITTTSDARQTTIAAPFDTPAPTGKRISWREIPQQ